MLWLLMLIPDKVKYVGWNAFWDCSGLEDVSIGHSVKTLGGGTYWGCDNIGEVWSYIEEPFDLWDIDELPYQGKCFSDVVTNRAVLYVPAGTKNKYLSKRGWLNFRNIIEMDDAVISPSVDTNNDFDYGLRGALYDLQGRQLHNKPSKGVYIQDGKKHVVR